MKYLSYIQIAFILLVSVSSVFAQNTEKFQGTESVDFVGGASNSILLPFDDMDAKKRFVNGHVKLQLDLGEDYALNNEQFEISTNISLTAYKEGVEVALFEPDYELKVVPNQPEAFIIVNLMSHLSNEDGDDEVSFDEVAVLVNNTSSTNAELSPFIRLNIGYEATLTFDVQSFSTTIQSVVINDKQATFNWSDNPLFSHYQLQVLRLHNLNPVYGEENEIETRVNWKNSIMVDVDLEDRNLKNYVYTLAGGTGFYAFRIRPVGGYYNGSKANSANWGGWSESLNGSLMVLNESQLHAGVIYFDDTEENINWIYSRVYTENSRVKEQISYADGLMKIKQQQTFLPSKNITLIQQTVYDYIGRPTVTSIPVPVPNRQNSYYTEFMKSSETGEIYQAKHFDEDDKIKSPDPLDESGAFGYYSNNADKSIANTNGFGYTRTLYYNDGINRVREQSGIGEKHSLDEVNGGKTTRYLYATPTDEELIAIFGDEAPASESVLKTITIDPNGTSSVTYTSKEGNVIATSLVFTEQENNLLDLDEEIYNQSVMDYMTENVKRNQSFTNSKRLVVSQPTDLNIGYNIKCEILESTCLNTEIDCDFQLTVLLHSLDDLGNIASTQTLIDQRLSEISCETIGEEQYKVIPEQTFTLNEGTYIIEKFLTPGNAGANVSTNQETIELAVYTITDLVAGWLENIENTDDLDLFLISIQELAEAANSGDMISFDNAGRSDKFPVEWSTRFQEFYLSEGIAEQYCISFTSPESGCNSNPGANPATMYLVAPCCEIEVPVQWIPPFDCTPDELADANSDGYYNAINYYDLFDTDKSVEAEYFPDFEGYMIAYLSPCLESNPEDFPDLETLQSVIYEGIDVEGVHYNFMQGWEVQGTFNRMVYHMLTDVYDIDGDDTPEVAYECDHLLACWTNVLSRFREELCGSTYVAQAEGNSNVSEEFDEQNDGDGSVHDDHFDDNFKGTGFITRWIAKRKISKRMRNLQTGSDEEQAAQAEPGLFNMVEEFINCAGQKFGKIITPLDPYPFSEDIHASFGYILDNVDPSKSSMPYILDTMSRSDYFLGVNGAPVVPALPVNFDDGYVHLYDWNPVKYILNDDDEVEATDESLFPNVKNPIYAYKYFVYKGEGQNDYLTLEQSICYNDPNDCFQIDGTTGLIVVDAVTKKPIKVPCCSLNPTPTDEGCFADYNYPNLENYVSGEDVFDLDGSGDRFKWVVNEFCESGRIQCPQTKEDWNAGQRLTFYNALKTFVPAGLDESISDFLGLNCTDIAEETQWLYYSFAGDKDYQDLYGLEDIISEVQLDNFIASFNNDADNINLRSLSRSDGVSGLEVYLDDTDASNLKLYSQIYLEREEDNEVFAYYELEIESRLADCNQGCENKRTQFRNALMRLLEEKCYEIGGCRTNDPSTFHIVPEEDIDLIVDQIVLSCQEQCQMTTYSCEDIKCRPINLPQTTVGSNQNSLALYYGVGGYPDNPLLAGDPLGMTAYDYEDDDTGICTPIAGTEFKKCQFYNADRSLKNLSWYEYTLTKQATDWTFKLDLPSMCEGSEGERLSDMPYNEPDNPNSTKGSTFIPKDRYTLSGPVDASTASTPVTTPTKSIKVNVDSNE